MSNQLHYSVSSYLLCCFIHLEITTLSLVDTSLSPSNGSAPLNTFVSSKHEVKEESSTAKSRGNSQLPNAEGELQIRGSTTPKLTGARSKKLKTTKRATVSGKAVTRPRKIKPELPSKVPKGKKSKAKNPKATDWVSGEEELNLFTMAGDEDIYRKATERTSTTPDDYEWEAADDWDAVLEKAEKEKRLFDSDLIDTDDSQSEPISEIKKSERPTIRNHMEHKVTTSSIRTIARNHTKNKATTSTVSRRQIKAKKTAKTTSEPSLRGFEDETTSGSGKSLIRVTHATPEPQLRGFEESVSVLEGETASVIDFEELDPEDYSVTYVSLDGDDDDDVHYEDDDDDDDNDDYSDTTEEYDEDNGDGNDYTYEEDYAVEDTSDVDYTDYDKNVGDKSESAESHKTKNKPVKPSSKRKAKLKKTRQWIKEEKKGRKEGKQQRKSQSIVGMRKSKDRSMTKRRRVGAAGGGQSRATRLGFRRRFSRRHFGRNAGKEVCYGKKGRRFYRGPRKRFALRGKAKLNSRIYRQPKTKKARRG